jgi:formylglycine-generating enzyme
MKFTLVLTFALLCADAVYGITIETVPVGNPGNPADGRYADIYHPNGFGSVNQSFDIGKTEVTNAQYVALLNAVAKSDPYGLYSTSMATDTRGGIVRSGASGNYVYSVKAAALGGAYTYDNKPVVFVSWCDALRFANWLHNGQPTGAENSVTTEDGAYTLNGATTDAALASVTRNNSARWWLPSENEWYKAAYHKNDGITANYWYYPTHNDSVPNNNQPSSDSGNSANFHKSTYTTGNSSYPMTNAGAYTLSGSSYGTIDQGGNVSEWNETPFEGTWRGYRGGSWLSQDYSLEADFWDFDRPTTQNNLYGFRVAGAAVPEPSTIALAINFFALLATRRRCRG